MAVSLGILDFLTARISHDLKIKWPNDMLVRKKKIAGILIENGLMGDGIQQSIVGIGLNINQTVFSVPTATSLKSETGLDYINADELGLLLQTLENRYLQIRSGKLADVLAVYLKNLYRMGEEHDFIAKDQPMRGRIEGIDDTGKLKINSQGAHLFFSLKEISFVHE
jgi:BirA family biotin operon repressor/biotin-[acetyl-CoA-carboxylase] ligase